ncbi:molybdopterin adenylyltransferase [Gammaproteobacteria bacterium]
MQGLIVSTNLSTKKGEQKSPVQGIVIDKNGVVGDAHAGPGMRQVSILGQESLDRFNSRTGKNIQAGAFGENLTISGIDLCGIAVLDRLKIGKAVLEITQIGKKCHGNVCAIYREVGQCAMPKEGVFARVISGGKIQTNDKIRHLLCDLQILIITLSDRAAAGVYEDRSGPLAYELIEKFFSEKRWHIKISRIIIPDDAKKLEKILTQGITKNIDIMFTLGGTGIGPRDITPEVVTKVSKKIIPGIMENIRLKYGTQKPAALLSRSVAGTNKTTQLYALPGSVKAIAEYLPEIFQNLEHIIYMMHAIDAHEKMQ